MLGILVFIRYYRYLYWHAYRVSVIKLKLFITNVNRFIIDTFMHSNDVQHNIYQHIMQPC